MKLAELVLRYCKDKEWSGGDYEGTGKNSKVCFCAEGFIDEIRRMFHFPKKPPKRVWLTLHSRPSIYREELRVCRYCGSEMRVELKQGDHMIGGWDELDELLCPFIGKTVYLQVEYEG